MIRYCFGAFAPPDFYKGVSRVLGKFVGSNSPGVIDIKITKKENIAYKLKCDLNCSLKGNNN